jgi:oligopeptidase A
VHDNAPLIKRILEIKKETSAMLGYSSFAEKSLASKMAPSVDSVLELTEMLRVKAFAAAQRELAELQAFAEKGGFKGKLAQWDLLYWSMRLRNESYQFNQEEAYPYFSLPNVLDGLFALAERLFGVKIEAADGEAEVWNDDVKYFKISDATTGEHIANFYLDPYSRTEGKRGGAFPAWMSVCLGKSKVLNTKPVAYLVCNFYPPVGDMPSFMTFSDVEALFHEFGHGLQHMLTKVPHGYAAGIMNVEGDAIELPSQFMENWCYDRRTIDGFAR